MADRGFPDGRMQKLMGKPWSSWNLPEQPIELDLRKLRDAYQPPEQYRSSNDKHSTPLPSKFLPLFGTHPDSDFLSIQKCPACGWLLKIQHANKHYLRDSRGAIVCKDSDLAIFGSKVLGRAVHPVGELKETWSRRITLRVHPPSLSTPPKPLHTLRGTTSLSDIITKGRSGSHSTIKTDYLSHSSSQYRSRSSHSQMHVTPSYMPKSRSGGSSSHSSLSINSSSKGKSGKSHSSSSTSSWSSSSMRSSVPSKSSHKTSHGTSGSYTLSIPSEDMGQNETVEDILMSNMSQFTTSSSKHTVHIIATQNKSKSSDTGYDHVKYHYSDVPEKKMKLDSSHSRSDHHHRSSLSYTDSHDSYKSKSRHSSSSLINGSESSKKSKPSSSSSISSSSLMYSKSSDSSSPSKHHLRSTSSSAIVTISKPIVSVSSLSSQTRTHTIGSLSSSSLDKERDRDKDKSSISKKKKRKRDKDEPRKIIPLKDRDFNPDKHCGVCPPGSSSPCKRSLTCKTHSIASRRAVNGRSQSFDALLAAHKLAKNEEKVYTPREKEVVVEEIAPPKAKKKKLSGTSSTIASSPNELGTLGAVSESTSYVRTKSPDVEVIAVNVKPKPKPLPKPDIDLLHCYSKKFKQCPLVYPYTPEVQSKFESVWYNPPNLDRMNMTPEDKHKFVFLLKHYKNPYFLNCDIKPLPKNPREKRNVFSNWNASEKQVEGSQLSGSVNWATTDGKRQVNDEPEDLQCVTLNKK